MADLLGFGNIIRNSGEIEVERRIEEWTSLVDSAATKNKIENIQLISDTVFAQVGNSRDDLLNILQFAQYLLNEGVPKSLPIRGAICFGSFNWGRLTYGESVVKAYDIESSQNWIGVTCDNGLPYIEELWKHELLICYPVPMKNKPIYLFGAVDWNVPETGELVRLMGAGGLMKERDLWNWAVGEKINNTCLFGAYKSVLARLQADRSRFHGFLPIHAVNLFVDSKVIIPYAQEK